MVHIFRSSLNCPAFDHSCRSILKANVSLGVTMNMNLGEFVTVLRVYDRFSWRPI